MAALQAAMFNPLHEKQKRIKPRQAATLLFVGLVPDDTADERSQRLWIPVLRLAFGERWVYTIRQTSVNKQRKTWLEVPRRIGRLAMKLEPIETSLL
jgi:hypothetical protein